jgi:branched-chain amino acid transport system permease protein
MNLASSLQVLVYGLFVGGIYGIAAVGLALVFGVLKMLNIAHGELIMLAGYLSLGAYHALGLDPFLSLLLGIPALFVLGLVLDQAIFQHIARLPEQDRVKNSLLASFGLTLIFQNLAVRVFSADERAIPVAYAGAGLSLFGVHYPYTRLGSLAIALVTIAGLHFFLHRTYAGKTILATAEDWASAELAGIDTRRVYRLTLGLSAGLAAIAGTLVVITNGISPSVGLTWTLKALIVVVLAGTGSILGAFPAGLLLGAVEAVSGSLLGETSQQVIGLVIFVLVLVARPQGLFQRDLCRACRPPGIEWRVPRAWRCWSRRCWLPACRGWWIARTSGTCST